MAKGQKTGGGSRAGKPNKTTAEVKALAQKWGPDALLGLAILAGLQVVEGKQAAESEMVRKAAMDSILDRAYGKPPQSLEHSTEPSQLEQLLAKLP